MLRRITVAIHIVGVGGEHHNRCPRIIGIPALIRNHGADTVPGMRLGQVEIAGGAGNMRPLGAALHLPLHSHRGGAGIHFQRAARIGASGNGRSGCGCLGIRVANVSHLYRITDDSFRRCVVARIGVIAHDRPVVLPFAVVQIQGGGVRVRIEADVVLVHGSPSAASVFRDLERNRNTRNRVIAIGHLRVRHDRSSLGGQERIIAVHNTHPRVVIDRQAVLIREDGDIRRAPVGRIADAPGGGRLVRNPGRRLRGSPRGSHGIVIDELIIVTGVAGRIGTRVDFVVVHRHLDLVADICLHRGVGIAGAA